MKTPLDNQFLMAITQALQYPIYVIDAADYSVLFSNQSPVSVPEEEVTCYQLTHHLERPCNNAEHPCPVEQVVKSGQPAMVEHVHYTKDGRPCYVEVSAYPIFDADGKVVKVIECSQDITSRKEAENALAWEAAANAVLVDLAEALIQTSVIEDISYIVMEHAQRITGSRHSFVGYIEPRTGFLISPTLTREIWEVCQVPNKSFTFEKFTGLWGWVLNHCQPLLTNAPANDPRSVGIPVGHVPIKRFLGVPALLGNTLVGLVALANSERDYQEQDLILVQRLATLYALAIERKRNEDRLAQQARELARSNEELERFAYVASHDLQEPLRMVASYVQLIQRRYGDKLDADAHEFIGYAVDGATQMRDLINGLLAYSRVGTKGKEFQPTDCNMLVSRSLTNLRISIEESGAEVTCDPLPTVMADTLQLGQVFQNLISNAIKFRRDENPRVAISATQQAQPTQPEWVFTVRDNGIGIEPDQTGRLFAIFQRLHTRSEYPGTGIGLAMCKRILERHGGRIWIESQPGQGSTFFFTLPSIISDSQRS